MLKLLEKCYLDRRKSGLNISCCRRFLPDMRQSHRAREAVPKGCPTEIKNNAISLMVGSKCCAKITAEARGDRKAAGGASTRSARERTPTLD